MAIKAKEKVKARQKEFPQLRAQVPPRRHPFRESCDSVIIAMNGDILATLARRQTDGLKPLDRAPEVDAVSEAGSARNLAARPSMKLSMLRTCRIAAGKAAALKRNFDRPCTAQPSSQRADFSIVVL